MDIYEAGGAAFPGPAQHTQKVDVHEGMTLRDYFAAKAMEGDLANAEGETWRDEEPEDLLLGRARLYYRIADSMLKVREE